MMQYTMKDYLAGIKAALDKLDIREIGNVVEVLMEVYERGSRIFVFGNGGSAATASHLACDINKGACLENGKRFRVHSLTDGIPTITAYANDISFEDIFIEQLRNFIEEGDIVIGISGSGNSKNILKAIEYANSLGNVTIGLTGFDGGKLRKICRFSINANTDDMQMSEDIHMIVTHMLMKQLSERLKAGQ